MKISKALLFAALLASVGTTHASNCANQPNNNTTGPTAQAAAQARANDVLPGGSKDTNNTNGSTTTTR